MSKELGKITPGFSGQNVGGIRPFSIAPRNATFELTFSKDAAWTNVQPRAIPPVTPALESFVVLYKLEGR